LVDRDGIQGAAGDYVYRIGDVAAVSVLSSGLQGMSDAFTTANSTRAINPLGGVTSVLDSRVGESVGLSASAKALSKLSETFSKRLDEVIPAIHVPNGGRVTAVILASVEVAGLVVEASDVDSSDRYRGLDAHR
jgi:hypothetical protein